MWPIIKGALSWIGAGLSWIADRLWGDAIFAWIRPMIPAALANPTFEQILGWAIAYGPPAALAGLGAYFVISGRKAIKAATVAAPAAPTPIAANNTPPKRRRAPPKKKQGWIVPAALATAVTAVAFASLVIWDSKNQPREWRLTPQQKSQLAQALGAQSAYPVHIFPVAASSTAATMASDIFEVFSNSRRPATLSEPSVFAGTKIVGMYVAISEEPGMKEKNENAWRFKGIIDRAIVQTGDLRSDARIRGEGIGLVVGTRP